MPQDAAAKSGKEPKHRKKAASSKPSREGSPISRKKQIIDNVVSLGTALLLVLMIRSSVIEAFKIPSGSMIPTLFVGDHIFVNKFAYGFKLPFTDWFMDDPIELIDRDGPKQGDIVVFKWPRDESIYYIKRVIGVPGDTIQIKGKRLYVNDKPVEVRPIDVAERDKILSELEGGSYDRNNLELHREALGPRNPVIMTDQKNFFTENWGPETVPADHYFMMGDNRDYSNDSRFWGFVHKRLIKGRALFIWLSIWIDFKDWSFTFHPKRIGTVLD